MNLDFIASAEPLGKVFWCCAIGGTAFFIIRLVMMLIGHDFDAPIDGMDHDIHLDTHSDAAFQMFSINSVTAFLMMFGWGGLTAFVQFKLGPSLSIIIAFIVGVAAMFTIATLFKLAMGLVSKGEVFKIEETVGLNASVYQRIPADGVGKVNVSLPGGILRELDAVSEGKVEIESFKTVKVIKVVDNKTISVSKI
ncbi:MAG: hypothetical protein AB7S78_07265 [Candidatus Omnitrophota bacterium]